MRIPATQTLALALASLQACASTPPRGTARPPFPPATPAAVAIASPRPAVQSASTSAAPPPPAEHPLVFVQDDYPKALAEARARRLPLFVDAWAPWCHTCLSMRSFVFPDRSLERFADRFVWLSLDAEKDKNAPLVARLGLRFLPTLYVIDAGSEQPVVAWESSLTAAELVPLLEDAEVSVQRGDAGGQSTALLLRGHEAGAGGKLKEAIEDYRAALAAAPAGWPRRAQAIDSLVTRLLDDEQYGPCLVTAAEWARDMDPGTPLVDVLRAGVTCAESMPPDALDRAKLGALVELGERVVADPSQPMLDDDRSDLYQYLVNGLRDLGHHDPAKKLAAAWSAFLDDRAAKAPDPGARAVFDSHRLLAYVAIGEPQRAVPMLEASERDFPSDYNPPARLATAYLEMRQYDESLRAIQRALRLAYGPRKLRLWSQEADICKVKGDEVCERRALEEAVAFAKGVPLTREYPKLRDRLQRRLEGLR